jgi:hypothetical protein
VLQAQVAKISGTRGLLVLNATKWLLRSRELMQTNQKSRDAIKFQIYETVWVDDLQLLLAFSFNSIEI